MPEYKYDYLKDGTRIVRELVERDGQLGWARSSLKEIPEEVGQFPEAQPGEIDKNAIVEERSRLRNAKELARAKEEYNYFANKDARKAVAKDLGIKAPLIASVAAADRLAKGVGDIANFGYDLFGGEKLKDWGFTEQSPIQLQIERDKDYERQKELMQGFYDEQPFASMVGEVPVFMATSAALTPLGRTVVGAGLSGVSRGVEATAEGGRGLFTRGVEALRTMPGRAGQVGERIYQESVFPRQTAARAASRRSDTMDPAIKGTLKELLAHTAVGGVEGVIDPEMTVGGGMLASAIGSGTGQMAKRAFHRTPVYWRDKEKELLDWYEGEGGRLLPGMKTGSRRLQKYEGALENQDRMSDLFNLVRQDNQRVTNKIAWEAAGIPYEANKDIDKHVLTDHMESMRRQYEEISAKSRGIVTPDEMMSIGASIGQMKKMKSDDAKKALKAAQGYFDEMRDRVKPKVSATGETTGYVYSGKDFQSLRSRIKSEIDAAYANNNRTMVNALTPLLAGLDASLERGVSNLGRSIGDQNLVTKWKDLNERYAMTKIILEHGTDVTTADFSPSKFMNYISSHDPERAILEGGNRIVPLFKLAKVNDLMRRQAKPGLSGSVDLPQTKAGNPSSMSTAQSMMTANSLVGKIPLLDRTAMALYKRGYPASTGLLGWTGDQVYRNIPDYTRAMSQSSQLYPWIQDQAISGGQGLMSLGEGAADKLGNAYDYLFPQ